MTGFPAISRRVYGDNDDEEEGSGSENVTGNIPGGPRTANLMKAIHEVSNAPTGPEKKRIAIQERSLSARDVSLTANLSSDSSQINFLSFGIDGSHITAYNTSTQLWSPTLRYDYTFSVLG